MARSGAGGAEIGAVLRGGGSFLARICGAKSGRGGALTRESWRFWRNCSRRAGAVFAAAGDIDARSSSRLGMPAGRQELVCRSAELCCRSAANITRMIRQGSRVLVPAARPSIPAAQQLVRQHHPDFTQTVRSLLCSFLDLRGSAPPRRGRTPPSCAPLRAHTAPVDRSGGGRPCRRRSCSGRRDGSARSRGGSSSAWRAPPRSRIGRYRRSLAASCRTLRASTPSWCAARSARSPPRARG